MLPPKALSYQAFKFADSAYKQFNSLPLDSVNSDEDAQLFLQLSMQASATNGMFTENLRIEQQSLKTAIESFQ